MHKEYDVVIVGGGMVGSLLACALGGSPLRVAVLERTAPAAAPKEGYDLRVSAITLASCAVFEALGAWPGMQRRRVSELRELRVWDAGGSGTIRFDSADIGEPRLGYIIENSVIVAALQERLQKFANVDYRCPAEIAEIVMARSHPSARKTDTRQAQASMDRVSVALNDAQTLNTRLLVGADGAHSLVRRALGIGTTGLDLHQQGIVATVATEKGHEHIAWQRFLPTGPLAFLPLHDPRVCSIVWSADTGRAEELLGLDDAAFLAQLHAAFGDRLGQIVSVSKRAAFPLALSHAKRYTAARAALIGDAAHTVHPLAGQGVNLGFMDAATLAEVILDAGTRMRDVGTLNVLRRYERWRKADNLAMLAVTGAFKYVFGNSWPAVSGLRNLALELTDKAAPVKNVILRRACGLDGDLPQLARRPLTP
ncbi:MAG: FAD-dependent 2-octaprenylphenol hydroxylase [Gammaproteobacteria bacterium]|nr:MAG: FAD-dependent 2-octaprenylphenol hydroxylase [Gammaproteobacteria bacterium]